MNRTSIAVAASCMALLSAASATAAVRGVSGATVTHFSVTYPGNVATCNGNRIQKEGSNAFIKDVETCHTVLNFWAPGTYDIGDPASPAYGWCSDFDGFATCNLATAGRLTISDNGDGTFTWAIVAYYSEP